MKCYIHPDVDAQATCTHCGKAVCQACAVDVGGKVVCTQCLAAVPVPGSGEPSIVSRNPLAIVSLVLAVLGLLACVCGSGGIGGLLFGVPGAITGFLGRKKALEAGDQQATTWALVGLIGGCAESALGIVALLLGVAALGIGWCGSLPSGSYYR